MTRVRGESVAPGIAVGQVYLRGFAAESTGRRIAADEVETELNRLREALQKSRAQVEEIKQKQSDSLGEAELRIFDAHLAYLGDAMFVTEIETQVMQERLSVREAVQLVFAKYDRIFQLVESDLLRRRASDLRDVATRLLRNLDADGARRGDSGGAVHPGGAQADHGRHVQPRQREGRGHRRRRRRHEFARGDPRARHGHPDRDGHPRPAAPAARRRSVSCSTRPRANWSPCRTTGRWPRRPLRRAALEGEQGARPKRRPT
jgi:hypothetical protein